MTDTTFFDEEAIFKVAFQISSQEGRATYLNQVCGDRPQAVKRILALLRAHDEAPPFLSAPAPVLTATAVSGISERPGDAIGPYRLREQIGEGGFGAVYVAEQVEPICRKVALKIIKPGMDSRQVVARLESERQALAMMDHPNIARMLDSGTTETGRPYFVMELVHGVPVTDFCDQQKLTNRERLKVFVDVCRAVQHAHQKGVIHRDLKPSNIIVTLDDDRPVPKVIDFGVSKALSGRLTDKTLYTAYGQMVGTPLYMAPEQASMTLLDVDTRSDVYSLGVLLYELLTGTTPFDRETLKNVSFDELRRIIQEDEPPRPSTRVSTLNAELITTACEHRRVDHRGLGEALRGELDWIVMKSLEKDRNRRYESASAFAADIQRYLNDEPVLACPPTTFYRFRKFARRNGTALAAAVIAALSLLIVAIASFIAANKFSTLADEKQVALTAAERSRDRANLALYNSLVSQAGASRTSRRPGQRFKSLEALQEAAALLPRLELHTEEQLKLRNEAIAAMGLIDLHERKQFPLPRRDWFATFDPQRQRSAYADSSDRLAIWEGFDKRKLSQLPVSQNVDQQSPRVFTRDGRFLCGVELTGEVFVWDVSREEFLLRVDAGTRISPGQISVESGRLALIKGDGSIDLFDLSTTRRLGSLPTKASTVSLSADGSQAAVAVTSSTAVEVWDCEEGNRLRSLPVSGVFQTAWSPDSKLLACGLEKAQKIVIWNLHNNELCTELVGHHNGGLNFCFNHDGSILASASWDSTARLWDPLTGHELLRTRGKCCEFRGVDDTLALRYGKSAHLWRLSRSEECQTLQTADSRYGNAFTDAAFCWGGPVFAYARRDGLRICNLQAEGTIAFAPSGLTDAILFHRDTDSLISSGSAGIYQWPITVSSNGKLCQIGPPRKLFERNLSQIGVNSLAQSGDGSRLAAVVDYRTVKVFSLRSSFKPVTLSGHRDVYCVTISPDGRWVVTATNFGRGMKVWNADTGQQVCDLWPEASSGHAAFSPDGALVAVCTVEELRILETESWNPVCRVSWELVGNRLAWSPDSRLIVIAAEDQAQLIDPQTGQEVATFTSPNNAGNIESLTFSLDGGRLAIVYRDAVEVWDLRRVRRRLAGMNLDWDLPALPTEWNAEPLPETIEFDLGAFGKEREYGRLLARLRNGYSITQQDAQIVDEALNALTRTIENDHGNVEWRLLRGRLNWALGRDDEAIKNCNHVLQIEPENVSAYYHRARAYLWANDLESAIHDYEAVCRLAPGAFESAVAAAMGYVLCQPLKPNSERALELTDKCLKITQNNSKVWHTRGIALYRLGRLDEAEQAIQRAIKLGIRWMQPHLALAAIYQAKGDAARAREAFRVSQTTERFGLENSAVYVILNALWRRDVSERLGIDLENPFPAERRSIVLDGEDLLLNAKVTEGRMKLVYPKEPDGTSTLNWCASHERAQATFAFSVPEAGTYRVSGRFEKSPLSGIARVSASGQQFQEAYDGYAEEMGESERVDFGSASFAAGANEITIEVVGSNPESDGFQVHIEEIKVSKE